MYDSGDSTAFWLNVTNIVLGLAVIGLLGLVLFSALRDIRSAVSRRVGAAARTITP